VKHELPLVAQHGQAGDVSGAGTEVVDEGGIEGLVAAGPDHRAGSEGRRDGGPRSDSFSTEVRWP
jgi:hypothetical protein